MQWQWRFLIVFLSKNWCMSGMMRGNQICVRVEEAPEATAVGEDSSCRYIACGLAKEQKGMRSRIGVPGLLSSRFCKQ